MSAPAPKTKDKKKDKARPAEQGDEQVKTESAPQTPAVKTAADIDTADMTRKHMLEYLKRVEDMLDAHQFDQSSDDDRAVFVGNVLSEMDHDVYRTCCDLVCSRVLEKLFRISDSSDVSGFALKLLPFITDLAANRYGSHVLQAIIGKVLPSLGEYDASASYPDLSVLGEGEVVSVPLAVVFLHICRSLYDEFKSTLDNAHAGHVLADCVATLAGLSTANQNRSKASRTYRESTHAEDKSKAHTAPPVPVPAPFRDMLSRLADVIISTVCVYV